MMSSLFNRTLTLLGVVLLSGAALTACDKAVDGGNQTDTTATPAPEAPAAADTTTPAPMAPESDSGADATAPSAGDMAPAAPQEMPSAPSDMGGDAGTEATPDMPAAPEQQ